MTKRLTLTHDQALEAARAVLTEARAYFLGSESPQGWEGFMNSERGRGWKRFIRPQGWEGFVRAAKIVWVTRAMALMKRAEALISFAAAFDKEDNPDVWRALAQTTGTAEHGDHLEGPYREIEQNWPAISEPGGHGYWPAHTPEEAGYAKGFSLGVRFCPYLDTTSEEIAAWNAGYDAGYARRRALELENGKCPECGHGAHEGRVCTAVIPPEGEPCGCDQTDPVSDMLAGEYNLPDRAAVWRVPVGGRAYREEGHRP